MLALLVLACAVVGALAQEPAQIFVTREDGFGRLIVSFPERDSLPDYRLRLENGVLALEFGTRVSLVLPDIPTILPEAVSAARIDPDGGAVRLALRTSLNFNHIEAGERLFIDLLPPSWQGLPPGLPQAVIDELAERARLAALAAERERKAREALDLDPRASVRIGRNPTFLRLYFNWSVETEAEFVQQETVGRLQFEWPVPVDIRELLLDLPPELAAVDSTVTPDGAGLRFDLAEGVVPRFFALSERDYVLDIDLAGTALPPIAAEALLDETAAAPEAAEEESEPEIATQPLRAEPPAPVTPFVTTVGSTVRVVFPFEEDVPAAVFRRGNTLWMLFDTDAGINSPREADRMQDIASGFEVTPAGDTQIVRLELSRERLATLGSEGRAWVLSLGDTLLNPTEPIVFGRRLDPQGLYEMTADLDRPGRIHEFRDPLVGDLLHVITAYPPARGVTRSFDYVDFSALRSVHGLVVKPRHEAVGVGLDNRLAVVTARGGLTVSPLDRVRSDNFLAGGIMRTSFVDLASYRQDDPALFAEATQTLLAGAASAEGRARDLARLELAQHFLANRFAHEAIGVLDVLEQSMQGEDLSRRLRISQAIANTLAHRPREALGMLQSPLLAEEVDALVWRAIARADAYDFHGAREDALAAEPILGSYPVWVQTRFRFAAVRAAVETGDARLAGRLLDDIDFATLSLDETSLYHLMSGRIEELEGRMDQAIETYGQVIAEDVRPTRAEAIYRTLRLLDQAGTLDLEKAAATLAAESLLWRGDPLEADMQKMLAEFYFRHGAYRLGFETVRQAVAHYPENPAVNALRDEAQRVFIDLFLNGRADSLGPVDALGLYYDFRHLTPPGARGDEMIRNLARRLVRVDLLPQAAELLEYQVGNRLTGAAQSQVAADLAVIYLADRQPQLALSVLNRTRLSDISASLARQRRVLEVRALIDGGRFELALDLMRDMDGRDVELMRIDANWKAGRYSEAAAALEAMYADETQALSEAARMNIVKAAVGFVLADDQFGLTRLRARFGDRLVTTPQWPMFDFVTSSLEPSSLEFRRVAREVAAIDSLNAFLNAYREVYAGEGALTPLFASRRAVTAGR